MPDYERMYHILCAAASRAIDEMDNGRLAGCRKLLQDALTEAEELYISWADDGTPDPS